MQLGPAPYVLIVLYLLSGLDPVLGLLHRCHNWWICSFQKWQTTSWADWLCELCLYCAPYGRTSAVKKNYPSARLSESAGMQEQRSEAKRILWGQQGKLFCCFVAISRPTSRPGPGPQSPPWKCPPCCRRMRRVPSVSSGLSQCPRVLKRASLISEPCDPRSLSLSSSLWSALATSRLVVSCESLIDSSISVLPSLLSLVTYSYFSFFL